MGLSRWCAKARDNMEVDDVATVRSMYKRKCSIPILSYQTLCMYSGCENSIYYCLAISPLIFSFLHSRRRLRILLYSACLVTLRDAFPNLLTFWPSSLPIRGPWTKETKKKLSSIKGLRTYGPSLCLHVVVTLFAFLSGAVFSPPSHLRARLLACLCSGKCAENAFLSVHDRLGEREVLLCEGGWGSRTP